MRTKIAVILLIFVLCGELLSAAKHSIEELRTQAASAPIKDQPKLYIEVAKEEIKVIEGLYSAGDSEKAQATIQQLVLDCESATKSSTSTRKHLKHTEITLRKIVSRLDAIQKDASFDDRAPIKSAMSRIEKMRTELLDAMFAK